MSWFSQFLNWLNWLARVGPVQPVLELVETSTGKGLHPSPAGNQPFEQALGTGHWDSGCDTETRQTRQEKLVTTVKVEQWYLDQLKDQLKEYEDAVEEEFRERQRTVVHGYERLRVVDIWAISDRSLAEAIGIVNVMRAAGDPRWEELSEAVVDRHKPVTAG
jgi:hypothetical protein